MEIKIDFDADERPPTIYQVNYPGTVFEQLDIEGVDWAVISEIDADEAFSRIRTFTRNLVLGMVSMLNSPFMAAPQVYNAPLESLYSVRLLYQQYACTSGVIAFHSASSLIFVMGVPSEY